MKLFFFIALYCAIVASQCFGRGHYGTFTREIYIDGEEVIIEFFVAKPLEKDPAKQKSWRRIIARGGKMLEKPIYVDDDDRPIPEKENFVIWIPPIFLGLVLLFISVNLLYSNRPKRA